MLRGYEGATRRTRAVQCIESGGSLNGPKRVSMRGARQNATTHNREGGQAGQAGKPNDLQIVSDSRVPSGAASRRQSPGKRIGRGNHAPEGTTVPKEGVGSSPIRNLRPPGLVLLGACRLDCVEMSPVQHLGTTLEPLKPM